MTFVSILNHARVFALEAQPTGSEKSFLLKRRA